MDTVKKTNKEGSRKVIPIEESIKAPEAKDEKWSAIEAGLERLKRAADKEKIEEEAKAVEEAVELVEENRAVLSREEEGRQNEIIREKFPNDVCPACDVHVVDARYLALPQAQGIVVCGNCGNLFMPKSRLDLSIQILEEAQEKKGSQLVVPKGKMPKLTL